MRTGGRGPTERGAAVEGWLGAPGRSRSQGPARTHRGGRSPSAALTMTPLLPLLMAVSAVAGATGTALPPTTGDATLAIVFDVTGSMWDDLMQVMDGASRILERSLSRGSRTIANYALVPFHDPGSAPRAPHTRRARDLAPWLGVLTCLAWCAHLPALRPGRTWTPAG